MTELREIMDTNRFKNLIFDPADQTAEGMIRIGFKGETVESATELFTAIQRILQSESLMRIATERLRQMDVEGWDEDHDSEHRRGELAEAAACYAHAAFMSAYLANQESLPEEEREVDMDEIRPPHQWPPFEPKDETLLELSWPWAASWWKPGDRHRMLEKAGALIAAELDRLKKENL